MAFAGNGVLMDSNLFRLQHPNWPGLAPRNPDFTDSDERADDEPAYPGGMTERQERLASRDENGRD